MTTLDDQGSVDPVYPRQVPAESVSPILFDGQRLDQPTFHELYLRTPEDFRAELIEGVVYVMSSPVNPKRHGRPGFNMALFLNTYSAETPGTVVQGNSTVKLAPDSEVQPDAALLIEPAFGGRTTEDEREYTIGCPELVAEISSTTLPIDLTAKKRLYERAGALEYVVHDVSHRAIHWFSLQDGRFEPMPMDADGLIRSRAFPGLWLDPSALLRADRSAVLRTVRLGLESPEHAVFVRRLEQNRANRP